MVWKLLRPNNFNNIVESLECKPSSKYRKACYPHRHRNDSFLYPGNPDRSRFGLGVGHDSPRQTSLRLTLFQSIYINSLLSHYPNLFFVRFPFPTNLIRWWCEILSEIKLSSKFPNSNFFVSYQVSGLFHHPYEKNQQNNWSIPFYNIQQKKQKLI